MRRVLLKRKERHVILRSIIIVMMTTLKRNNRWLLFDFCDFLACRSLCLNRRASSRPGLFSTETVSPKGNSLTSWRKRSEKRILRVPFVCEKLSFYQARLGTNIGQALKRSTVRAGHRVTPGVQAPRLVLHAAVRTKKKAHLLRHSTPLNMIIILPRQALDNHRESSTH